MQIHKKMNTLILLAVVLSVIFTTSHCLSCVPCAQWKCTPDDELNCKGGLTTGKCGCCNACAKIEGEKCGGIFDILGICDAGLKCVRAGKKGFLLPRFDRPGICRRIKA